MAFNPGLWWQKVKTFFWNWTPTWIKQTFGLYSQNSTIPPYEASKQGDGAKSYVKVDKERIKEIEENALAFKLEPVTYAAIYGSLKDLKLLTVNSRYDINNHLNADEKTPLHYTVIEGKIENIQNLLEAGARTEELDIHNNTPLHTAASTNQIDAMEILLQNGAAIDPINDNHNTPLHLAAEGNNAKAVEILLKKGADVTKINKAGKSPVDLATNETIKDLFLQAKERQMQAKEKEQEPAKKWQERMNLDPNLGSDNSRGR